MTRNNLREHLSWLLAPVPPNPSTARPPGDNSLTSQGFLSRDNTESLNETDIIRSGECPNNGASDEGGRENCLEILRPSASQVPVFHSEETMVRLQSGPRSSKKSRLLSQPDLEPLQTPKASQPLDSIIEDRYGPAEKIRKKKLDPPTPTTTKSKTRFVNAIPSSVDLSHAVDQPHSSPSTDEVFGEPRRIWREDSASRKEPVLKRGKKRKSEEFESALKLSQGGFTAVEAFPEEAPPPYSETYEDSAYIGAGSQNKTVGRHATATDYLGDIPNESRVSSKKPKIVSEDAFPSVPRISKPREKLLGKTSSSQDRVTTVKYEVQAATAKPRRTIADSEEENEDQIFDELDESFWIDKNPGVQHKNYQANYPVLPKNSSSRGARPDPASVGHNLGHEEAMRTDRNSRQTLYPNASSDPSPFQCDSPTKLPSIQVQQIKKPDGTDSQLTTVEKASVKAFLAMKPELIRNYHQGLIRARTAAAEKLYQRVFEQGGEPTTEMQQQSTSLKAKIDATTTLFQLRDRHIALSQQKEDLKSRLIAAITEERPASHYALQLNENTTAALSLAQIEWQIFNLLVRAEIPLHENISTYQENFSEIPVFPKETHQRSTLLVKSTQLPRNMRDVCAPRERTPNSDRLILNQEIRQTQGVSSDPRTPQKQCTRSNSVTRGSPIQTYMSSPKITNLNAYSSPSKRKPLQDQCVTIDARQGSTKGITFPYQASSSLPSRNSASMDNYAEKYARNMASPLRTVIDEENYGQEEDDDDMLEAAEEFEKYGVKSTPSSWPTPQKVFAESTGNVVRAEHRKACSLLPNGNAQSSHMQHPWSRDVKAAMKDRFHLRGFRPNQLEAINATLSGKNTFVLMPTGGGKSLCYQLPSIIRSGKTRGVTVVFSPLLSLMQDQVEHLRKLKIQAFVINGEVSREERMMVMESLREQQVEKFIQLLYITPEMISKSQAMVSALRELYERKKLARIVIDEAHCVSEWGHDFRPDYKLLGDVRKEFVGVPVMALTATATENAKVDVVHNLGIQGCEVLTQSFNRPNLTYEVRSKGRPDKALESIANTIQTLYKNQSGIIYCLSRKNCEKVAESLREQHHITAEHYHAGMDSQSKNSAQRRWQSGEYHVIVATIAFGMGIDKPDVRFVIHHSMPKSLEGYYQETGRAGRDGKRSGCYLYYGRQDLIVFNRMIDDGEGRPEQKERQRQMLRNVVGFCENKSDCRRVQVLRYFDETFRREDCNGACDNCTSKSSFETQDYTDHAVAAIALVKRIEQDKVTLLHCVDIFRGGKGKKIIGRQHDKLPQHGVCSHLEREDVERLFYRLLSEEALQEKNVVNKKSGFPSKYLYLGPNHLPFARGGKKVKIQIRVSPKSSKVKATEPVRNRRTGTVLSRPEHPISTNVSSPIQVASRRQVQHQRPQVNSNLNEYSHDDFVISDNDYPDSDEESDYFESVREAGKPERSKTRKLGPPITIDEKLEGVDPAHRFVIDDFLVRAKKESDHILLSKNLRAHPFTDTVLREMAINFPKDETEMLEIPGIDPDKVERYGQRFLKLIRNAQRGYYEMKQQQDLPRNVPRDAPNDPNHQNVITISSDDEFADDYDLDDFMDEDGSQEERSSYFHAAPEVDAFNARFSQIESARVTQPAAPSPKRDFPVRNSSRGSYGGGHRGGGGKSWYRRNPRKSSTGAAQSKAGAKSSRSGKKSTAAPRNTNNNSFGGGGSRRQYDSGGGGGIGMMPT